MSQQITENTFILKHTHAHTCTNKFEVFGNEKVFHLIPNFSDFFRRWLLLGTAH